MIEATWLWTGEADVDPIPRGRVVVDERGTVLAVGPAAPMSSVSTASAPVGSVSVGNEGSVERFTGVLMPGLVNARVSLELSLLRARVPGGRGFVPWLAELGAARAELHPELDAEAIDAAVGELIRTGTAAIGEVTTSLAALEALASAPLVARVFHEVAGLRHETAITLRAMAHQERSRVTLGAGISYALSPHSLLGLHPEVLVEILEAAASRVPLRLAWTAAERAFLADGGGPFAAHMRALGADPADWDPPGRAPIEQALALDALSRCIATHLSDLRGDEVEALAETPCILCPRASLHVELKLPPLLALRRAGIEPGLGTDSLACAGSLDVMDEVAALAARFPSVPARELLAMATSWGARVLGLSEHVGRLAVGLRPGVILFEAESVSVLDDPLAHVVASAGRARRVIVRPGSELR